MMRCCLGVRCRYCWIHSLAEAVYAAAADLVAGRSGCCLLLSEVGSVSGVVVAIAVVDLEEQLGSR